MKNLLAFLITIWIILSFCSAQSWSTPFESGQQEVSATYAEAIQYYQALAEQYSEVSIQEIGQTDVGKPLHVVYLSKDQVFDPETNRRNGKRILLINNAIHAGEPCGVDACMMLARDLLQKPEMQSLLAHAFIAIIPAYNVGGMLNRGCCSRANQNGPLEYGFRGNAQNYDLNRDFIKTDSRNMLAFGHIFQSLMPDIFIDTHTTNGADYAATLTYIATHPVKAGPAGLAHVQSAMIPDIEQHMESKKIVICPYVNNFRQSPDYGISGFLDLPRYSSGYAALFQTMSFITEAHMLKPFKDRVWATYRFLEGMLMHIETHHEAIGQAVQADREAVARQNEFDIAWRLDRDQVDSLSFAGYAAKTKPSVVTGEPRLYYDQDEPYVKNIPFYNTYRSTAQVSKPIAYLIPQSQYRVIELLRNNQVEMSQLQSDTMLTVEVLYIDSHHTAEQSYEGHYSHDQVEVKKDTQTIQMYAGDYVVFTNQIRNAYLVHVLEPKSQDSFFRWNYFDSFLMRKEYFSPYVFEEKAAEILSKNADIKEVFEQKKSQDSLFASMSWMQLNFLYEQSEHYEATHKRYPIFRWFQPSPLPHMK